MALYKLWKPFTVGHAYVKFKGDYDWDGLFKLVSNWIMNRKYDYHEDRYQDKKKGPAGSELKVKVYGRKDETPFVRQWIHVYFHIWGMKEKKGVLHEEEKEFTGGRLTIDITAKIELDWQGRFKGSKWKEVLGKFYVWVMRKEIQIIHVDNHEYEALRLEHEIKKFLRMETDTHAY